MPGMANIDGSGYPRCVRALLIGLVLVAACGPATNYDYSKEPDPRKHDFVIGPSDVLRITVWKNPELSTDAHVRPDGTITMPLIGDVQAAYRTPKDLKAEITRKLSSYIRDEGSVVSIAVTEVNSYRFTISGNVERAGVFSAKYYVTIAEAVAMAGGLNKFSNGRLVIVRSDVQAGLRRIPIDFERISSSEHPEENLVILSGDTVFAQ
ncbi:MAG: outer rane polysaccharide exporter [Myxococcales bacterium]|nr:outer rane polysaccharide exporter [Myxococcales bacterium]